MASALLVLLSPTEKVKMERLTEETKASVVVTQCGGSPSGPDLQNQMQQRVWLKHDQKGKTACFWPRAWRMG